MATKYFEKYFKYKSTGHQAYLTFVDCNRLTPLPRFVSTAVQHVSTAAVVQQLTTRLRLTRSVARSLCAITASCKVLAIKPLATSAARQLLPHGAPI